MKVRNGFVSNSSSSSFIITLPKDKNIRLSEMETCLGGYSDELTDDLKDILSYFLWRTIKDKKHPIEESVEHHEQCIATGFEEQELLKSKKCLGGGWLLSNGDHPSEYCKSCKFLKTIDRPIRSDDYYEIRDNEWISNKSIIDENKDNFYITIDDNEPNDYISFEDAYELRQSDSLFKDPNIAVEVQ